ncbi:hypothetical protein GLU60_01280 [Nanohaloarchaea archaeon H01]|nr:hypothetical protein [Nanohaloarchaea archaeon H01]
MNENNLETPKKEENSFINAPVLEVELFWNLVNKLQKGNLTLEQMLEIMNKETNWEERRKNKYLCQYNIKRDIGRLKSQKRIKKSLNKVRKKLNSTEKLFTEKTNKDLEKLESHGADFIDDENNVIEVKKSLHKYNIRHALLQLIYARDTLTKVKDLKIYTRDYEISQENLSGVKRMLSFYNIEIYSYNPKKDNFIKKDIPGC